MIQRLFIMAVFMMAIICFILYVGYHDIKDYYTGWFIFILGTQYAHELKIWRR